MNFTLIRLSAAAMVLALPLQSRSEVPAALALVLEKHGCREIIDPAAFQNLRGNWWVSLKEHTGRETDFAFYCHDKADPMVTRFIVEASGESNPWKGCRQTIKTWERWQGQIKPDLPVDLQVVATSTRNSRLKDLRLWWEVDSSRNPSVTYGPVGAKVSPVIIDTTGQSAGGLYACHEGKWYTIGID